MQIEIGRTAVEGFRLAARRPLTLAALAAVWLVAAVLADVAMVTLGKGPVRTGPQQMSSFASGAAFLLLVFAAQALSSLVVCQALAAPALKARRPGVLQLVLFWLSAWGLTLVIYLAGIAALGVVAGGMSDARRNSTPVVLAMLAWMLGVPVLHGVLSVRLSLAPAIAWSERRLGLATSWRLTRGHVWPLLGCHALVALMGLGALIATTIVLSITQLGSVISFTPASLAQVFWWPHVLALAVAAVFLGLWSLLLLAPGAAVYRQMTAVTPEGQASVFD